MPAQKESTIAGKSPSAPSPAKPSPLWLDGLAIFSLVLLASYFLFVSWRKWPDPQIDFGRELYLPWRLSLGAILGRDIEPQYGPLSQYFNAGLFAVFGPGMMVLVAANLIIYGGIFSTAYWILRQGWGTPGAWAGMAVFVSIFSFSQFVLVGNYNYATPYAHEATHGLLICLLLTVVLIAYVRQPNSVRCALAGVLFGLTIVLKVEFILAGLALAGVAVLLRVWVTGFRSILRHVVVFLVCAALPSLLFFAYFVRHVPVADAFFSTERAWMNLLATTRFTDEHVQTILLGLDHPLRNLLAHILATSLGLVFTALVVLAVKLAERSGPLTGPAGWKHWGLVLCLMLSGGLAGYFVPWMSAGKALLGLATVGLLLNLYPLWSRRAHRQAGAIDAVIVSRILFGVLAVSLMGRILLSGRFQHYGFFQAAAAGMMVVAAMSTEWPARFIGSRFGRWSAALGVLAFIATGVFSIARVSNRLLGQKTLEVGTGTDHFYAFTPAKWPAGELIRASAEFLARKPSDASVLVLPEGVMINYLIRRPTPTASYRFFASDLSEGREARMVEEMKKNPPAQIVLLTRDLREFGVNRYGGKPGEGGLLLQWVASDYQLATKAGGDPLDPFKAGIAIYRPKPQPKNFRP